MWICSCFLFFSCFTRSPLRNPKYKNSQPHVCHFFHHFYTRLWSISAKTTCLWSCDGKTSQTQWFHFSCGLFQDLFLSSLVPRTQLDSSLFQLSKLKFLNCDKPGPNNWFQGKMISLLTPECMIFLFCHESVSFRSADWFGKIAKVARLMKVNLFVMVCKGCMKDGIFIHTKI